MLLIILLVVWSKKVNTVVMTKKIFNKKTCGDWKNDEDCGNFTKYQVSNDIYIESDVKVRDYCLSLENVEVLHIEIVISKQN